MTNLYLIAHKVRGEPAFDVAEHMTCPTCNGTNDHCPSCDGAGHWWIIPTSGHRAFPYWDCKLNECLVNGMGEYESITYGVPNMPPSLRDHYTTTAEAAINLIKVLGINKPAAPLSPILRRL